MQQRTCGINDQLWSNFQETLTFSRIIIYLPELWTKLIHMLTIVFLFMCYVSVFIITVWLCLWLLCMLFLIFMILNICNIIQRTEQVHIQLDISDIEDYILLLLLLLLYKCKMSFFLNLTSPNKKGMWFVPIFSCHLAFKT